MENADRARTTDDARITQAQIRELLWPVSVMTIWRAMHQEADPFPAPQKIRGRNYWRLAEVRAWLDRQDEGGQRAATG